MSDRLVMTLIYMGKVEISKFYEAFYAQCICDICETFLLLYIFVSTGLKLVQVLESL